MRKFVDVKVRAKKIYRLTRQFFRDCKVSRRRMMLLTKKRKVQKVEKFCRKRYYLQRTICFRRVKAVEEINL